MEKSYSFDETGVRRIVASVHRTEKFLGGKGETPPPSETGAGFIYAKITGSTQDGSNKRWKYSWEQVEKTAVGYGGWTTKSGGLSGTQNAFNHIENMNSSSGGYGNGVSSTNLVGTIDIKAVPNNAIVSLELVRFLVSGTPTKEYWFRYENGVDGACP